MSTGLHVDVHSVEELAKWLKGIDDKIDNFSVPLTDLAIGMEQDVREAFSSGGGSVHQSWAPLAESTIERMQYAGGKRSAGFGEGPSGNLLGSIRRFVRNFVAGVEAPVPHAHLFEGGRRGSATAQSAGGPIHIAGGGEEQPGRDFLVITEERTQEGIDLILDYALGVGRYEAA